MKSIINEHKQIVTRDYDALWTYCLSQPKDKSVALNKFIALAKAEKYRSSINKRDGSYNLKHSVEDLSRVLGSYEYISNQQLIIAMVQAGFKARNCSDFPNIPRRAEDSSNYFFNISSNVAELIEKLHKVLGRNYEQQ